MTQAYYMVSNLPSNLSAKIENSLEEEALLSVSYHPSALTPASHGTGLEVGKNLGFRQKYQK